MNPYIYCAILSSVFLVVTLYYVKKRKLEFQYCIFWITIDIILIVLSSNKNLVEDLAKLVGINYAPALLFVTGIVFSFLLIFYITIVISDMKRRIVNLTQELGILKSKVEEKEHGSI